MNDFSKIILDEVSVKKDEILMQLDWLSVLLYLLVPLYFLPFDRIFNLSPSV